jgi:hypothetical protein
MPFQNYSPLWDFFKNLPRSRINKSYIEFDFLTMVFGIFHVKINLSQNYIFRLSLTISIGVLIGMKKKEIWKI